MANIKKFLDSNGLTILCRKFQDYPDNEILGTVINAIDNIKVDKVEGKDLSTNDYTNEDKEKLSSIASGAEVNQNAFSNVVVGSTTIAADSKTDSLTFIAGDNVTLTPDITNDKITISSKDTVYTHPSYTARTGVPTANQTPAFGGTFSMSQPVSDSTGHITAINSRTVTIPSTTATTSAAGLMSADDKSKLDDIAESADSVSFTPNATSGNKIGTITINGTATDMYSPTQTTVPSHNQAASTITAGTFAGQVIANSSSETPGTLLLRNSALVSIETTPSINGEICWLYE